MSGFVALVASLRRTAAQLDALARSLANTNPTYVPLELPLDLRLLTDDQLGEAWRDSQTALERGVLPVSAPRYVS